MPQITLEYTDNIKISRDFNFLFSEIHQHINRILDINPLNCKSRALELSNYFIADGEISHAFAHLQIQTLNRHNPEKLKILGESVFKELTDFFKDQVAGLLFQPSVEIAEMKQDLYFKWPAEKIKGFQ